MTTVNAIGNPYSFQNTYQSAPITGNDSMQNSSMPYGSTQLQADYARDFGLGYAPVYNASVSGFANYGYPGMYGGMYNPYMPSQQYLEYLNMTPKDRLAYDYELRDDAREFQYNDGKSSKRYAVANDGLTGAIRTTCKALQGAIIEGETDQIMEQFHRLKESIRNSTLYERLKEEFKDDPVGLEDTLSNCVMEQFMAATGQDLQTMIREHCDSSLEHAFWKTVTFGHYHAHSADDIISRMNGMQTPKSTNGKAIAGKVGGVLAGMGTGALAGAAIGAFGGPIGWGIGAIAGGIVSLISAIAN